MEWGKRRAFIFTTFTEFIWGSLLMPRIARSVLITITLLTPVNSGHAESQPLTVVVAANRVPTDRDKVASSITVIGEEEILRSQKSTVAELLRSVPGVDVVQSGAPGGNAAVFLRGANSEHTLVLIDGVEANNPLTPTRSFNFTSLTIDNVERIEVLRGPQSTLYGSDALGGVINIITKRGRGAGAASLSVEGGSYEAFREQLQASADLESIAVSLSASREDVDGVSSAAERLGNSEDDAFANTSFALRLDSAPTEHLSLLGTIRYTKSDSDLDNGGGFGQDDPNRNLTNEQLFSRVAAKWEAIPERTEFELGFSYAHQDTDDENDPDDAHPVDSLYSDFRAITTKVDLTSTITLTESARLLLGTEAEKERGASATVGTSSFGSFEDMLTGQDLQSYGYFAQLDTHHTDVLGIAVGLRVDDYESFNSETTWRAAPWFMIPTSGTRIFGTIGSGFKAPSLYQRYSSYGRPDLRAEESLGWDVGFEQPILHEQLSAGFTYFKNDFDDLISFDPGTFLFENIAEASSAGFETFIQFAPSEQLSLRISHTYTDSEDETTNAALLRRARNKAAVELSYTPHSSFSVATIARYVGTRWDNDFSAFPATREQLGSYVVVDIMAQYQLSKAVSVFARIENLFDKEYEEVLGFGEQGIGAYGGVTVRFGDIL